MSRRAIGLEATIATAAVVPVTAMVATGHTWMAAGTCGAVLATFMVIAGMRTRAENERHREELAFVQTATNLGADPTQLMQAMRRWQSRRHRTGSDRYDEGSDRYDEDDAERRAGTAGVHWPPRH